LSKSEKIVVGLPQSMFSKKVSGINHRESAKTYLDQILLRRFGYGGQLK
jgi:hypothetical protein